MPPAFLQCAAYIFGSHKTNVNLELKSDAVLFRFTYLGML